VQGGLSRVQEETAEEPAASPGRFSRALWLAIASAHLAVVVGLLVAFELLPKAGWAAFLLYAPRAPLAIPALITVFTLRGRRRILPLLTAGLVLGPLMGLHVNGPGRDGQVRLVTWHVWFGAGDPESVRATLASVDPDIVVLEAADLNMYTVLAAAFPGRTWVREDQYVVGSRWPAQMVEGGPVAADGWRSWMRFAIDSPIGTLDVLAVHPHSPRTLLRGSIRRGLRSNNHPEMEALEAQLRDVDDASRHGGPLRLVAGDFNSPELSGLLNGLFVGTRDAFATAGNGYGYTFPTHGRWIPWMRLDRVLTGPGLHPTRAQVIGRHGSDHAAILVEFDRATR
jgi:endonuclease/exonuclease/phosphatase (EEP) superfamily protein YafD